MSGARRLLLAGAMLAVLTGGCAGAATGSEQLDPLFDADDAERARELAPDLYARADRARKRARRAGHDGKRAAAADYATRARLLLAAAFAEAERIQLEQKRLDTEARARRLTEAAVRDERARRRITRRLARTLASRVAARQATRAFESAREAERRRARARRAETERAHRQAAEALVQRARVLLAAARTMGASAERSDRLHERIEAIQPKSDPTEALAQADETVRRVRRLLGELRAGTDGPGPDERAAVVETARQSGFEVQWHERGLIVRADGLVPTRRREAQARLERLATLLRAHPHGPIRIEIGARSKHRPSRSHAEARGASLRDALVEAGVDAERLVVDVVAGTSDRIEVVLVSYGERKPVTSQPK